MEPSVGHKGGQPKIGGAEQDFDKNFARPRNLRGEAGGSRHENVAPTSLLMYVYMLGFDNCTRKRREKCSFLIKNHRDAGLRQKDVFPRKPNTVVLNGPQPGPRFRLSKKYVMVSPYILSRVNLVSPSPLNTIFPRGEHRFIGACPEIVEVQRGSAEPQRHNAGTQRGSREPQRDTVRKPSEPRHKLSKPGRKPSEPCPEPPESTRKLSKPGPRL